MSEGQNGGILAWYLDKDNNGMYEIYIGQKRGVIANSDSTALFAYFINAESMDLTKLNTKNLTDMSNMFYGVSSLTRLDVSNFDTSNVTNMKDMFNSTQLTTLKLNKASFDNVSTYNSMFVNSSALSTITVKNTNAKTFIDSRLSEAGLSTTATIAS